MDGLTPSHLYKMTHDIERDKYSDLIWLDYEGFKMCYEKPPKYVWFIDLENYRKVRLDKARKSAIIKQMQSVTEMIRSGTNYKNPGPHCASCEFNTRCLNSK